MIVLALGVVLTTVLLVRSGYVAHGHAAGPGSMSPQWVAACQASQQASSS